MVFWKYFYVSVEALTINIHSSPKFDKHLFLRFFYCPVDWKIYLYLMILPFSLCLLLSMYYANQLSLHIVKRWSYVTDVLCGQKHNPTWPHEPGTQQYPTCGFHVLVSCGKTRNGAMECGWAAPALGITVVPNYSIIYVLVGPVIMGSAVRPNRNSEEGQTLS